MSKHALLSRFPKDITDHNHHGQREEDLQTNRAQRKLASNAIPVMFSGSTGGTLPGWNTTSFRALELHEITYPPPLQDPEAHRISTI